ncbi:guanylate kinase [Candidatus Providencia siddallii]|uniref:Guanylate kinase n=1 Tax=Candidatus Providencia siddallii TaxID=1715285 RepID=A0ABM9NNQ8_9GAMM
MTQGILYIISAPSGTGKSSLINSLLKNYIFNNIKVSISYTTRTIRSGEKNGKHYFFISKSKFLKKIKNNDFLEYAYIFENYYGTSKIMIEKLLNNYTDVILNIDWQGALQIRKKILKTRSIFILPPSKTQLFHRLKTRGQDNKETIKKRISYAINEIEHFNEYDYLIINDDFNTALNDLQSIIRSEHLKLKYQIKKTNILINNFLKK